MTVWCQPRNEYRRVVSIQRQARTGRPLGDAKFLKRAERFIGRHLKPEKSGPKPKEKPRKSGRGKTRK